MEDVQKQTKTKSTFKKVLIKIGAFFKNATFLYILKRILLSLLTLLLLAILVTAFLRLLPDTKFYDPNMYSKILGQSGKTVADRWLSMQLYRYGITNLDGTRISIIESVGRFIYWILPIYKKVPIAWDTSTYLPIKYWEGFIYLGRSTTNSNEYVTTLVGDRMGISMVVSLVSIVLTYICAVPLGIAMAKKPGGVADKIGNTFLVLNYAIPGLVFFLLMNQLFGKIKIGDVVPFGLKYDENSPFLTLIPPIFCMWFLSIPGISIWVRRFMNDELSSDYVKFARSKGLSERTIMNKHVFRNALVPLARNIPTALLGALVGSYYVEYIWGIPGTGILMINGLQADAPDLQLVQGLTIIYGSISMLAFLLGDIITVALDPRIKLNG